MLLTRFSNDKIKIRITLKAQYRRTLKYGYIEWVFKTLVRDLRFIVETLVAVEPKFAVYTGLKCNKISYSSVEYRVFYNGTKSIILKPWRDFEVCENQAFQVKCIFYWYELLSLLNTHCGIWYLKNYWKTYSAIKENNKFVKGFKIYNIFFNFKCCLQVCYR